MIKALAGVLCLCGLFWGLALTGVGRLLCGVWLPYAAFATGFLGCVWRFWQWAATPVPFPIPLSGDQAGRPDAPLTKTGAAGRLLREVLLFRSLRRNTRAVMLREPAMRLALFGRSGLWLAALSFHLCLAIVLLRHSRFWLEPVPVWLTWLSGADSWLRFGRPQIFLTGVVLVCALAFLLLRRLALPSLRHISRLADYGALWLLLALAGSGLLLRQVWRTDLTAAKVFLLSLARLSPRPELLPDLSPLFFVHLGLACVLFAVLPFSKLLHGAALLLNPTRTLPGNTRAARYGTGWPRRPHPAFLSYAAYVSTHSRPIRRLTPQPTDRCRADCPSLKGGVTEKDFIGFAGFSTPFFPLKGEVSNHKGISDEDRFRDPMREAGLPVQREND